MQKMGAKFFSWNKIYLKLIGSLYFYIFNFVFVFTGIEWSFKCYYTFITM